MALAAFPWRMVFGQKELSRDTGWRTGRIMPRYAPVFPKSKTLNPSWEWRALTLTLDGRDGICFLQVSPRFGKWQAYLFVRAHSGIWTTLCRLEDQPRQSGLHAHAACAGQTITGATSIDLPNRVPAHGARHRRHRAWTRETFFRAACHFYRIPVEHDQPSLFDDT